MDTKQVVTNYHKAWTSGDVKAARVYLADDLDFQGSIDTFRRADDFIVALAVFQKMLRGINLIQSFFSESGAALLYDCDTMSLQVCLEQLSSLRLQRVKLDLFGWFLMLLSFENLWAE